MGIPKFYRWLSERYPLLNMKITATEAAPDIDNLYLDMNGIIHNCTHANQTEVKLTEEEMILKSFNYMDKLIQIVKPKQLIFMAIDGVAPRAKMNQQRSRRFKSAEERIKLENEKRAKGEFVPDDPFDSNCITPGTAFMNRLGAHIRFFIRKKKAEDPLWQTPTVIFSGHDVPGEGEHKIMEYIRLEKKKPGYTPNQRHAMYGLDADLVMLSLVTHEPHFCLLREVVSYTGGGRGQPAREVLENPCAENFILFQIGLLREYFYLEFAEIKLPWELDGERVVDDFVLFCMLIGNDFLPPLPTLDINEGALNKLIDLFKALLPELGGHLTYAGELDRGRLEKLLSKLGELEQETLEERAADAEFMEKKRAKRDGGGRGRGDGGGGRGDGGGRGGGRGGGAPRAPSARAAVPPPASGQGGFSNGFAQLAESTPETSGVESSGLEEGEAKPPVAQQQPTMMSREARDMMMSGQGAKGLELWKDRYYHVKLEVPRGEGAEAGKRAVVAAFIEGLHWVLEYYYRGVASWNWYYPYHYAPMASDLVELNSIKVIFNQGTPFRPFEQLLSVLPSASVKLLPLPFKTFMTNPDSPILDFYPTTFSVDMEGKRADWEGIVKVPFVDEVRLLAAAASVTPAQLTEEEVRRNDPGSILIFQYQPGSEEKEHCRSTIPHVYKDVLRPQSKCTRVPPPPPLPLGEKGFTPTLTPGTTVGLAGPKGYPTLMTLKISVSTRMIAVNVLGTPSRKESVVIAIQDLQKAQGEEGVRLGAALVAPSLLGQRCYVNWPYLQEATITKLSDAKESVTMDRGKLKTQKLGDQDAGRFSAEASCLSGETLTKTGVDVGRVEVMASVRRCLGYMRLPDGSIEKQYADKETQYPLQVIMRQRPGEKAATNGAAKQDDDVPVGAELKEGSEVLYLGDKYHGCIATILPDLGEGMTRTGRTATAKTAGYRVSVQPQGEYAEAAARGARRAVRENEPRYLTSGEIARQIGANPGTLGRITSSVWVQEGEARFDVGLVVKNKGQGLCVPGYSLETERGWSYTQALSKVLLEYKQKFQWVWNMLDQSGRSEDGGKGTLRLGEVLPSLSPAIRKEKVEQVVKWIKSLPLARRPLVKHSVQILMEDGCLALQRSLPPGPKKLPPCVELEGVSMGKLLPPYTPGPNAVKASLQGGTFRLGDRVVSVGNSAMPPFGQRGSVIGVYDDAIEVIFDEGYPGATDLKGRVNGDCGAYVPPDMLLNISPAHDDRGRGPPTGPKGPNEWELMGQKGGPTGGGVQLLQHAKGQKIVDAAAAAANALSSPGKNNGANKSPAANNNQSLGRGRSAGAPGAAVPATPAPAPPPIPSSNLLARAKSAAAASMPPGPKAQAQAPPPQPPAPANHGAFAGANLLQHLRGGPGGGVSTAPAPQAPAQGPPTSAGASLLKHLKGGQQQRQQQQPPPQPPPPAGPHQAPPYPQAPMPNFHPQGIHPGFAPPGLGGFMPLHPMGAPLHPGMPQYGAMPYGMPMHPHAPPPHMPYGAHMHHQPPPPPQQQHYQQQHYQQHANQHPQPAGNNAGGRPRVHVRTPQQIHAELQAMVAKMSMPPPPKGETTEKKVKATRAASAALIPRTILKPAGSAAAAAIGGLPSTTAGVAESKSATVAASVAAVGEMVNLSISSAAPTTSTPTPAAAAPNAE